MRDSPNPWHCLCLHISFKAAMAHLIMCATVEPGRFQCGPALPGEVSSAARRARRTFPKEKYRIFLQNIRRKIRHIWRKIRFRYSLSDDLAITFPEVPELHVRVQINALCYGDTRVTTMFLTFFYMLMRGEEALGTLLGNGMTPLCYQPLSGRDDH
jgi:hypothetical protein